MRKRLWPHLAIYAFFLCVALIITWPLVLMAGTRLIGHPFGDSYEYLHHIWWLKHALPTGQPLFFQPLLGYPDGLPSIWLWSAWLQSFPVVLLTFALPLPLAYNLVALLRLALNGWAMFTLMNHLLTGRRGPALLAGLVFMIFPTFQGQLAAGHVGLLALWPVPLYVYALVRADEDGLTRRWWLAGAALFTLSLAGNPLLLVFITGPVTVWMLIKRLSQHDWHGAGHVAMVAGTGLALALIFLVPLLLEQQADSAMPSLGGDVHYSADLLSVVTPSFEHPLFTQLEYTHRMLGIDPFERMGYVGVVAAGLAIIGVWRSRAARWWLLLAVAAWVLSLGPLLKVFDSVVTLNIGDQASYITLPWIAFQNLPLLDTIRTPARFQFGLALALAVMAGYGAVILWERSGRWRWGIFGALLLVIVIEYQSWWPLPTVNAIVPAAVVALAERDDVRSVLDLPWDHLLAQKDGMFLQTGHGKPLLAGHVTRRTPVNPAKLTLLQNTLDPDLLAREQVDMIIWHKQWAEDNAETPRQHLGEPIYEDAQIAIFDVPDSRVEPVFTAVMPDTPEITRQTGIAIFVPEPGWVTLEGQLQTNERHVKVLLDGDYLRDWEGSTAPIPLFSAGYHTLTIALEPPCPAHRIAPLACRAVTIERLSFTNFAPAQFDQPIQFERGLNLSASALKQADVTLSVWLWWRFAQQMTDNDIRFIHILDSDGNLIAQADAPLAGRSAWVEQVDFTDLPDGEYDVYTGWYTLPDVTRLTILSDRPEADNHWVHLGRVMIEGVNDS